MIIGLYVDNIFTSSKNINEEYVKRLLLPFHGKEEIVYSRTFDECIRVLRVEFVLNLYIALSQYVICGV